MRTSHSISIARSIVLRPLYSFFLIAFRYPCKWPFQIGNSCWCNENNPGISDGSHAMTSLKWLYWLTLINSVLSSIHTFFYGFSFLVRWPTRWKPLKGRFLWGSFGNVSKRHLVNWKIVNFFLKVAYAWLFSIRLSKWLWGFLNEKEDLWRMVIEVKDGENGLNWIANKKTGTYGLGLWMSLSGGSKDSSFTLFLRQVMVHWYHFSTTECMMTFLSGIAPNCVCYRSKQRCSHL